MIIVRNCKGKTFEEVVEYDVNKRKMTDRQTTDEKPWFLSRCDEIDSYV
jgi:hypothetical protein